MRPVNTGGHAFPLNVEPVYATQYGGMTLRDYFAAQALQGLLANPKLADEIKKHSGAFGGWIESSAYGFANAMLKARETEI
jgi:hypothetical protein